MRAWKYFTSFLSISTLLFYWSSCADPTIPKSPSRLGFPPAQFPDGCIFDSKGSTKSLRSFMGKPIFVSLIDLDYPASRAQIRTIEDSQRSLEKDEFNILILVMAEKPEKILGSFIPVRPVFVPIFAVDNAIKNALGGIQIHPTSFLVDNSFIIAQRFEGYMTSESIKNETTKFLSLQRSK